jgi:N-acetylglucosamine-6-phosphate deacetylase
MIVLSGADLLLPDRILSPGTLVIEGERIVDLRSGAPSGSPTPGTALSLRDHYIAPAFVDVHVHGVDGIDALDDDDAIARMAARLPRYGVAAFCPTTVACAAGPLGRVLDQVRRARAEPSPKAARVLPAHLESNFISPEYAGAQPARCLRSPRAALQGWAAGSTDDAGDILREIERAAPDVGIVTVAPELEGGLDLVAWLVARGQIVSLGHSGASYEEGLAAIEAGARQATHLFNRMPPFGHRAPGLAGAVLEAEAVAVELICDGVHVHPAMARTAIAAKGSHRTLAITDGTAAAGLAVGAKARLGGQEITAREQAAFRGDGTLAGSVCTMDRAFRVLVERFGVSPVEAALMCATTPARELGLGGHGVLAPGAVADLVVLDRGLAVAQTYIRGQLVYVRST